MKYSRQRETILRVLTHNPIHPSADCIYDLVKKEIPNISLATVYRNLKQLTDFGMIKTINGLDGSVRFDHHLHEHYHFICKKCGKVYDVSSEIAKRIVNEASNDSGFVVESCDISLKGICNNCKCKH